MANEKTSSIDLSYGEYDAAFDQSLIGAKTINASKMVGLFKRQNAGMNMRPSTRYLNKITMGADEYIHDSYEDRYAWYLWYIIINKTTKKARIAVYFIITKAIVLPETVNDDIDEVLVTPRCLMSGGYYGDLGGVNGVAPDNTTSYIGSSVWVPGFSRLMFFTVEAESVTGVTKIKKYIYHPATQGTISTAIPPVITVSKRGYIYYPAAVSFCQNRLICIGNLVEEGSVAIPTSPQNGQYLICSKTEYPFCLISSDTDKTAASILSLPTSEFFYSLSELFKRIVVGSNYGTRVFSGTGESEILERGNIVSHIVGSTGTNGSAPVIMASTMIYVSLSEIRMQQMNVITDIVNRDIPDQPVPTLTNYLPEKLLYDNESNILYGWCLDQDGVTEEVKVFWWRPLEEVQLLAAGTYFSDPWFNMPSIAPLSNIVVINETGTNNYYVCVEDPESGVGRETIEVWEPKVTVSAVNNSTRTITVIGLDSNVIGFWMLVGADSWNYFLRTTATGSEYICGNDTLVMSGVGTGAKDVIFISLNIYTVGLPARFVGKNYDVSLAIYLNLHDEVNGIDIVDDRIRLIWDNYPFYLEMLDESISYKGTVLMELAYQSQYPFIQWYGLSSFYGAATSLYRVVLVTSWEIRKRFMVQLNNTIPSVVDKNRNLDTNDHYNYATFSFRQQSAINENVMTLKFNPRDSQFNSNDCMVKNILLI